MFACVITLDISRDQEVERGTQVQNLCTDKGDGGNAGAGSKAEAEVR